MSERANKATVADAVNVIVVHASARNGLSRVELSDGRKVRAGLGVRVSSAGSEFIGIAVHYANGSWVYFERWFGEQSYGRIAVEVHGAFPSAIVAASDAAAILSCRDYIEREAERTRVDTTPEAMTESASRLAREILSMVGVKSPRPTRRRAP